MSNTFLLDGEEIPFTEGQTIIMAAKAAGKYIPHLCWHPDFAAHGSCKLCTVKIIGPRGDHFVSACTAQAAARQTVENRSDELDDKRRTLLQLLFVEGNHFCPSCEKSGNCALQATACDLGMLTPHFDHFFPDRPLDASHPEALLDFNRCIMCELCVRASSDVDGKNVFALSGRGIKSHLIVNSASGRLADTEFAITDRAMTICPVGVILPKGRGFNVPIGKRRYDLHAIRKVEEDAA
ncbi:MAG: 2Fe-2S iron-sulfur cluster-binding protein [Georgfuchsia sp.]